jgi:membrane-associated phospholipid phosphatase
LWATTLDTAKEEVETIWSSGIALIQALQGMGGWIKAPMQAFTALGVPAFYVLLLPLVGWCLDARHGVRLAVFVMASIWLNETVKVMLHQPRPFWLCPDCTVVGADSSFGFPSGHAQHAMVVWGLLALELRRRWGWWPVIGLVPFLIGLSRVYLGMHFPSDVVGGWLAGGLLLTLMLRLEGPVAAGWGARTSPASAAACAALGGLMLIIGLVIVDLNRGWSIPAAWLEGARSVVGPEFNPYRLDFAFVAAGMIPGALVGAGLARSLSSATAQASIWQRLARLPIGLAPLAALWWATRLGLQSVPDESAGYYGIVFAAGVLLGLWLTAGAPRLFAQVGLGVPDRAQP